ncbi:unnamed protein product, partial [Iphiclides podalirius]
MSDAKLKELLSELEFRLNKIESLYGEFDVFQTELEVLSEDPDAAYSEREQFETQYYAQSQLLHHLEAFLLQPGEYVPDVAFSSSRFCVAIGCWTDPTATAVIASAPRHRDPTNATLAHYHAGKRTYTGLLNIVTIQL